MGNRALAHIEEITEIRPILCENEPAKAIEMARVLDFYVVVGKDQFKVGDYVVFVEVDSILPEKPQFESLRKKKFTIKAMKMGSKFTDLQGRKIISQGIIFSTKELAELLPETLFTVGMDLTEKLSITKVVENIDEDTIPTTKELTFLDKIDRKFRKYSIYRKLRGFVATPKIKGDWADWMPSKSDETNIQNIFTRLKGKYGNEGGWVVTEKMEGSNISFYRLTVKSWFGFKTKNHNAVCSRNRHLVTNDGSNFWNTVSRLNLFEKINTLERDYLFRGELCGPRIQENIYKLKEHEIFVFEIWDIGDQRLLNYDEMIDICNKLGIKTAPLINDNYVLPETSTDVLEYSNGTSAIHNTLREGLVFRRRDNYRESFKARSPVYLAKG